MLKRGFQFAPGYRLQEFLGRGQFGQVWRATAPGGAATAVKFIDLSDGQGQKEYDGVKRVKQIRHANLMPITAIWLLDAQGQVIEEAPDEANETIDLTVAEAKGQSAVYRAGIEPSWLVVAMLLGGKSLQKRLQECVQEGLPGIPPKELLSYMDESAKGIDFLNSPQHDLGEGPVSIQHSDIKPANIVLIGSSAVVCDFGLARILTRNQVTATSASGTPAYMAPEAISGKPARTSDQYSLAVTYYHLRTGTLPVSDGSLWEVLDAHRQGKLKLGLVPIAEQEVLRKATDLNWQNRFETNVDMVDALRDALRAEGHSTPGFIPRLADQARAPSRATEGDATATVDLPPTTPLPTNPALAATAPLLAAEQSTHKEGFLAETLPELRESAVTVVPRGASAPTIWQSPKLLTGIGAGAIVLLLAGAIALRPHDQPNASAGGGDVSEKVVPEVTPDLETRDPVKLVAAAIATLDTDEQAAVASFEEALKIDPGLAQLAVSERPGHQDAVLWMLETPDGGRLITLAGGATPLLWDLASASSPGLPLEGHEGTLYAFALDPAGRRLVTGGTDYLARVWNLAEGDGATSSLDLLGHNGTIETAVWHPDGRTLVTASQDTNLGIWQLGMADSEHPHGTIARQTRIPAGEYIRELVSDADGQWLAALSVGSDPTEEKIDVLIYPWSELIDEVENSPPPVRVGAGAASAAKIGFLMDRGKPLVVTGDSGGTVSIHSPTDGTLVERSHDVHRGPVEALTVQHTAECDVISTGSADGSVAVWHYGSLKPRRREFCPELGIGSVSVSADGRWVAAGANDGSVWLWDSTCQQEDAGAIQLLTPAGAVDAVVIDVKSRWLIAGCADGVIRAWDLTLAKLLALARPTPPLKTLEKSIQVMPPLAANSRR
jgi:serine/threonine protein kinase/WD40 repeat protein